MNEPDQIQFDNSLHTRGSILFKPLSIMTLTRVVGNPVKIIPVR